MDVPSELGPIFAAGWPSAVESYWVEFGLDLETWR